MISEPGTLAGTRLFNAWNPDRDGAVQAYHTALRHLFSTPPTVHELGDGCELKTRPLALSAEAAALWIEFYNQIEMEQATDKELQGSRPFASKVAEHAARIAGIIEIAGDPSAAVVSVETMEGAIQVASFYISEHVRLTGAGIEDRHAKLLRMLLDWMQEKGRIAHKDLLQRAPNPVRVLRAEGINNLLSELIERGYVRRRGDAWECRP